MRSSTYLRLKWSLVCLFVFGTPAVLYPWFGKDVFTGILGGILAAISVAIVKTIEHFDSGNKMADKEKAKSGMD